MKKILIMGLPGSGKTTLAKKLKEILNAHWLNADAVRKLYKDWDFSKRGIIRQSHRMRKLANRSKKKFVIADFICPYAEGRKIFKPHFLVWVDTIKKSRYQRMNKIFEVPKKYNFIVKEKNAHLNAIKIANRVKKYKWQNQSNTVQMLGRYQPFHDGHKSLFEKIILISGQVIIYVKDVHKLGDNPFSFKKIKKTISSKLDKDFKNRYQVKLAPNISHICYGRKVGYKFKHIDLPAKIKKISGTRIRAKMRKKGIL